MKITWLNPEMTEAIVTRGWWRWKRQAHMKRDFNKYEMWVFVPSGIQVDHVTRRRLSDAAITVLVERERERRNSNWQPVKPLPKARVV